MKRLIIVLTILLLYGCGEMIGPGVHDFCTPLCGDYYVIRSSAHEIKVSPEGYDSDTPIIPPKVVALGHDNRYVIAKQNQLKRRSPDNPNDTYMEPVTGAYSFWILDSQAPRVYGPFDKARFEQKKKELGVPSSILMKDVDEYR